MPGAAVVSAASGTTTLAAGAIASIYGADLAPGLLASGQVPLPEILAGVQVMAVDALGNSAKAPLYFVTPNQINFVVPPVPIGPVRFQVINGGSMTAVAASSVSKVAPALFSANGTGQGVAAATVVSDKRDSSQTVELIFACSNGGLTCSPVAVDVSDETEHVLVLYGTGIRAATSVTVLLGGLAADVTYFGSQQQSPGLDQVNVRIPTQLAGRGDIDIILRADGQKANLLMMRIR